MGDNNGRYILDDQRRIIPEPDLMRWGLWMETGDRLVRRDADEATGWAVSTVFLGLDHRFFEVGPPIVFETMVFAPGTRRRRTPAPVDGTRPTSAAFTQKWDGYMDRYCTWDEAEAGHRRIIEAIARDLAIEQA